MPMSWQDKLAAAGVTTDTYNEMVLYFSRLEKQERLTKLRSPCSSTASTSVAPRHEKVVNSMLGPTSIKCATSRKIIAREVIREKTTAKPSSEERLGQRLRRTRRGVRTTKQDHIIPATASLSRRRNRNTRRWRSRLTKIKTSTQRSSKREIYAVNMSVRRKSQAAKTNIS